MKHNIIKTENYLLVVDDSEIKVGDWYLDDAGQLRPSVTSDPEYWEKRKDYKKVICHLPLNNFPLLEGVDLLPRLEDDVKLDPKLIDSMAMRYRHDFGLLDKQHKDSIRTTMVQLWEEVVGKGFYKAKEKYKYTEEDMCNFIEFVRDNYTGFGTPNLIYNKGKQENTKKIFERYKSLQQSKMPVAFDCEENIFFATNAFCTDVSLTSDGLKDTILRSPKTTTNSQGITQWIGKYIYE